MRNPPAGYKNTHKFNQSGDNRHLAKGYFTGGEIPYEKTPQANDPRMNIERELERHRQDMLVREPDINYEARPGTNDEPDKDEGEDV